MRREPVEGRASPPFDCCRHWTASSLSASRVFAALAPSRPAEDGDETYCSYDVGTEQHDVNNARGGGQQQMILGGGGASVQQ